jgi:hypothetical protein
LRLSAPNKNVEQLFPEPAGRAVILARSAHAGFGKAKVKARSKTKNYFCKVFDQTFFKKFVGCGEGMVTQ